MRGIVRNFRIFLVRAILGAGFAALMMRLFYPDKNILFGMGLAVILVGMAYLSEYLRERRENKTKAPPS